MLKKIAKKKEKKYTGPPPHEQFIFLWGTKGKKLPLGDQEKKSSSRGLKKGSFSFLWSPKGFFFHLVPQRKFFSLWSPKGKKFAHGGEDRYIIFSNFGNFFSTCEKDTQILEFCKDQGGKI